MKLSLFLISSVLILYCRPNFDRSLLEILFFRQQSQNSSIPNPATSPTVSSSKDITFYSIPSLGLNGIIAGTQISLTSDTLTAFTPLIAQFITTGKSVTVSGISQVSNVTANSYSSNLIYTVTAEDGSTKDFTVTLTAPRAYAGASLVIWLKADSLGLSDGTAVSNWNDLSGYGNHYTQATAGLRPTYRVNQINGLPSVQFRFSLTQKLNITAGGTNLYINNSGSFFIVFKLISTNPAGTTIINIHGSNGREMALTDPTGQYLQCRNGVACAPTSSLSIPTNQYIAVGSVQILNTTVNEIWNGDLKGTISAVGGNFDYVAGAAPGTSYMPNGYLDADIAEVLFFNNALTQNDTDKIFCYLRAKYNLSSVNKSCGI